MSSANILKKISLFSLLAGVVTALLHHFQLLGPYPDFSWVCFVFFTLLTLLVVIIAGMRVSTPGKALSMVMGSLGVKFIFSIFMVVLYILIAKPEDPIFILPFFVFYTYYAIIETYYLMKLDPVKK